MREYDKKKETKKYTVEISTADKYGYFEHNVYGDEMGGGLWFDENYELEDFDGMCYLPREVADAIIELGWKVDKEHFCEEE